jgi:hypothetical protein
MGRAESWKVLEGAALDIVEEEFVLGGEDQMSTGRTGSAEDVLGLGAAERHEPPQQYSPPCEPPQNSRHHADHFLRLTRGSWASQTQFFAGWIGAMWIKVPDS